MTLELEVSQRHILKPTLSIVTVQRILQRERQKWLFHCKCQGTMAEKCCFNILIIVWPNVFIVARQEGKEEGEKVKDEEKSQKYHFWTYMKNHHI